MTGMDDYFEGTLLLEALAEAGLLEEFYQAIESDDFVSAKRLMRQARVSDAVIAKVLIKMGDADGKH